MANPPQSPSGQLPPAADLLGRRLLHFDSESGMASLEFLAKPEFANRHGSVQGGLLAAMLDSATGAAVMASLPSDLTAVTLQLNTSFVKPAPIGPLRAAARVVAKDDRNAEVEAEIATPDGDVVARATAHLRILRRK
ncbi:MAG: PaaI family thioesterase [Candidatus Binataceae bacterium]